MPLIVDTERYISWHEPGRTFFPARLVKHVAMNWAYGSSAPRWGAPPYTRNPEEVIGEFEARVGDSDGQATIRAMDDAGVDISVIMTLDYEFASGGHSDVLIEERHQRLATLQRDQPNRLRALAGPDPRRPGAREVFDRAIKEHGLGGLFLYPKAGYPVWDERIFPLYERCLDDDLPVAISLQPGGGMGHRDRFAQPMQLADIVAEYPDLRLVVLHAGAPLYHWFEETINTCARNTNAVISLGAWLRGVRNVPGMTPSFVTDEESVLRILHRLKEVMGAHRILWGSDSPEIGAGPVAPNAIDDRPNVRDLVAWLGQLPENSAKYGIQFNQQETDWIRGENAARVFRVTNDPAWARPEKYNWRRRLPSPFKGTAG